MKIAHFSDTHLGYSAYRKVDESLGINQREMDLYKAFERCVDGIIESDAEVVLHSGDLFDTVRPSNRAISFTLEQLIRLTKAGKEVVLIAGNHSAPKLRETGSVFRIFDHLEHVHCVYKETYEMIELDGLAVHAVPHARDEEMMAQLDLVKVDKGVDHNVLMLHAGIKGVNEYSNDEFNEQLLPDSYLSQDMDYIALGHFHTMRMVKPNAYYSGSTERMSLSEAGCDKGWLLVDLESGEREFRKIPVRSMFDLRPINAKGMGQEELMTAIKNALDAVDIDGAIVRLNITNLPRPMHRSLDWQKIKDWASEAVQFIDNVGTLDDENEVQCGTSISALDQEFVSFLDKYPVEGVPKDDIRVKGLDYLLRGSDRCE
ncbi:MAG: DNA double-strand break repair protein Mre11 [Methanomassiliicoccales archaeon PtaU1.Bin124]|nr:MAG: DNA double-strand break repair protein Mre11 [Methanomassiliicoccales archaeon PtaU1.Bin124]